MGKSKNKQKSKNSQKNESSSGDDKKIEEREVVWKDFFTFEEKFVREITSGISPTRRGCCDVGQTLSTVILTLHYQDIHTHPGELVHIEFYPLFLEVKIQDICGTNASFIVSLAQEIVVKETSFAIQKDAIILSLHKVKPCFWDSIFNPPVVMENVKRKFIEILNFSSKALHSERIFADVCKIAEFHCNAARDFGCLLVSLNIPAVYNENELLTFYISKIQDQSDQTCTRETFIQLAALLLMRERNEYVRAHGDFLRKNAKSDCSLKKRWIPNGEMGKAEEIKKRKKTEEIKERGNTHFKAERFQEAIQAYTEAIELDPDSTHYYVNRSIAYFHLLSYSESIKDAASSVQRDPFNGKAWFYLAKNSYVLGYPRVFEYISQASYLEPYNKQINKFAVKILNFLENTVRIESALIFWIAPDPEIVPHFQFAFSNILLFQNFYRKTILRLCCNSLYEEAKKRSLFLSFSKTPTLRQEQFYCLGLCAYYEDDEIAIHDNFTACLSFEEEHPVARNNYEFIKGIYCCRKKGDEALATGQFEEAIKWFSKALKPDDVPPVVCSNLFVKFAAANLGLGKIEEAMSPINSSIDKNKDCHEAFARRGDYYLKKGEINKAGQDFESANAVYPCKEYGDCLKKCSENKRSASRPSPSYESYIKDENQEVDSKEMCLQKSLADCKRERGNKYLKSKDYNAAIAAYSEAINLDCENPVYYSNRSSCHLLLNNFEDALTDAKSCLEIDPSSEKGLLRLGKCHIAFGQPEEAVLALKKAIQINSTDENIKRELGRAKSLLEAIQKGNALFRNKDYVNAENHYSTAMPLGKACEVLHIKYVDCLVHLEKYSEAFTTAHSILSINSNSSDAYYFMGLCSYYKGEVNEAIKLLEKCLALDKTKKKVLEIIRTVKCVLNLKNLGAKAYFQNKLEDALSMYSEGLKKDPSNKTLNAIFHFNISSVHTKRKDWEAAVRSLSCAIDLNRSYLKCYLRRAECYLNINQVSKAVKDYEEANRILPCAEHEKLIEEAKKKEKTCLSGLGEKELEIALADYKKEKGNAYFLEKKYEDALKCYSAAISLNPDCAAYYTNRSACHVMQDNYCEGLEDAKEAVKRDSAFVKGHIRMGSCFNALGNAEEAIAAFEKAMKLDSKNEQAIERMALSYKLKKNLQEVNIALKKNQFEKTIQLLSATLKIACADSALLVKKTECLVHLQRINEVSDLIDKVPQRMMESAHIYYIRGLYFYQMDNKKDALKLLEMALDADPSSDKTKELINKVQLIYEKKEKGDEAFCKMDNRKALSYFEEGLKVDTNNANLQAYFNFNIGVIKKSIFKRGNNAIHCSD